MASRICIVCGTAFEPSRINKAVCSDACRHARRSEQKSGYHLRSYTHHSRERFSDGGSFYQQQLAKATERNKQIIARFGVKKCAGSVY